jgi:arylsulfatase A-like enzyme
LKPLLLAVLVATGWVASSLQAGEQKLNVLFIAVDDLRPELRRYGAAHIHSPHFDRLASRGLIFERAYCQVAVCNPSRSSLLSGTRPDTTRILANNIFLSQTMPDVVTLPQHFKNHGWHTVSLGKIFHHSEREPGDDPHSWSEPSWYHGKPYRHWSGNCTPGSPSSSATPGAYIIQSPWQRGHQAVVRPPMVARSSGRR